MEIKAIEKLLTCLFIVLMLSADYMSVNKVSAEIAPSVTVYGGGTLHCPVQYNIYYKPVNFANGIWQGND